MLFVLALMSVVAGAFFASVSHQHVPGGILVSLVIGVAAGLADGRLTRFVMYITCIMLGFFGWLYVVTPMMH